MSAVEQPIEPLALPKQAYGHRSPECRRDLDQDVHRNPIGPTALDPTHNATRDVGGIRKPLLRPSASAAQGAHRQSVPHDIHAHESGEGGLPGTYPAFPTDHGPLIDDGPLCRRRPDPMCVAGATPAGRLPAGRYSAARHPPGEYPPRTSGQRSDDGGDLGRQLRLGTVVHRRRVADDDQRILADDEEVRVVREP